MSIFDEVKGQVEQTAEEANPLLAAVKAAGLAISNLNVTNVGGNATITGSVEDGAIAEQAVALLAAQAGVSGVTNQIEVADVSAHNIMLNVATEESNLNIRKGPSTDDEIVGKAAHASQVLLVKRHSNDWYHVRQGDVEGYASTKYLKA
jgi:osmotically-inducible protein OsmY